MFILEFLHTLVVLLAFMSPIIFTIGTLICLVGLHIGHIENWSRSDSLYYAWITATTVGYGDFRPAQPRGKYLAILIAIMGLLLTGIIVSTGVEATRLAFDKTHDTEDVIEHLD